MKTIETRDLQTKKAADRFAFVYGTVEGRHIGTVMRIGDNGNIIEKSGSGTYYGDSKRQVRKQLRKRVEKITASEINYQESIEFVETSKKDARRFKRREDRDKRWHRFKRIFEPF